MTPFRAQGSGFGADFTPHPSCLPPRGGGQNAERHAYRLAGWTQKPQGRGRGSTGRTTRQPRAGRSEEASVLPAVTHRRAVGDHGLWLLLPAPDKEQGQVPAYGHGESEASHSLIEEQRGWMPDPQGSGGNARRNEPRCPWKKAWTRQDLSTPGGTESGAGRECQWLWPTLFSVREDNKVASQFATVALIHNATRFCMQYQNQPLEREKKIKMKKPCSAVLLSAAGRSRLVVQC